MISLENTDKKIHRLIRYYDHLLGTRDPLTIAKFLNIGIAFVPLGDIAGNYKLINRKRWIFINDQITIDSPLFRVVFAHELGHALLHRKENCAFLKNKTLLLTTGIEREANDFAAQLLIDDSMLKEYENFTYEQFCNGTGYPKELIELRLKDFILNN